ncbi:MAG TPA: LptF/LptG family permease [Tepidisphaeraceae bacterium]|jgi:lipopolysaccharide export LptBFGC system permease protein LptF|nr:LptF/LptG family permease [Tepidisphaeraceae bacterium]
MSRTLFWYVFKDLLKVFFLTAIALAGIMSFGGLLRPLTENGLDGRQVGTMLAYLLPAMATYSLPIAALFATTMVYGRLSSDNEVTACRAGGISFLSIATPAFLLGLFVAIVSLLLLCFIVPAFTFKVEQVIYSNLARVIANKIERTHQIPIGKNTVVYAQAAFVPPANPDKPDEQTVVLAGPLFIRYDMIPPPPENKNDLPIFLPKRFFTARKATVFITRTTGDAMELNAQLDDGAQFPREFAGHAQANVATLNYGPIPIASQVKEHPKFMDIRQLRTVLADWGKSQSVRDQVEILIRSEQDRIVRQRFINDLNNTGHATYKTATDTYTITRGPRPARLEEGTIVVCPSANGARSTTLRIDRPGGDLTATANQVRLNLVSDPSNDRLIVQAELHDAEVTMPQSTPTQWSSYPLSDVAVAMPKALKRIERRPPEDYLTDPTISVKDQDALRQVVVRLINYCKSEMHGRASFAVSCFVLVLIGSSLGLMFKSGNFLSAFAVSVVPALISIALIVTGQHTMEGIPQHVTAHNNPLHLGMALIWSGNAAVLVIGVILLAKLQRR